MRVVDARILAGYAISQAEVCSMAQYRWGPQGESAPTEKRQKVAKVGIQAVVFDMDGVLVDSLPSHLAFCSRKNQQFGLNLAIPDATRFRKLVRGGTPVSPMLRFFEAVGFPPDLAQRADADYRRNFSREHSPKPFEGVEQMLSQLRSADVPLGMVTSNTRPNVEKALEDLMAFFGAAVVTHDDPHGETKPAALRRVQDLLGVRAEGLCYVGDQPADASAAASVGMQFLGVTYGWGFSKDEDRVTTADSPDELAKWFLAVRACAEPGASESQLNATQAKDVC